jgi:serine/threonine protein kinase/tetratricopeptide (TPR) repeat protein
VSAPLVLANKYALLRRLGRGGMAEVFLAKHVGLAGFEKLVVVKRTLRHLADDDLFKQMFLDEARTAADLRHPNIVDIYEVGEDRGRLFLTMEFLHGRDLGAVLRRCATRGEPPPLAIALQIIGGVAAGLEYAHAKTAFDGSPLNIVHRDISPQNIVVTYAGEPKVVDFGIARAATREKHTQQGELRGKVAYVSPEQIEGLPVDGRADMFALGVVLYELTTLRPLFRRNKPMASLTAILQGDIAPPTRIVPGYPPDLEELVLRALARHPQDRFADLGEMAEAIDELAERHRLRLGRRRTGHWLRRLFADEIEDDRSLAHMPTLGDLGDKAEGSDADSPAGAWPRARLQTRPADDIDSHDELPDDAEHDTTRVSRGHRPRSIEPLRLPTRDDAFVGRTREMKAVREAFASGAPVVTVHGGHGVGKSRLALEIARAMHEEGLVRARYVELSEARTVEEVVSAAAHALEVSLLTGATLDSRAQQLARALEALCTPGLNALIVLDRMPLLRPDEIEALFDRWLHAAPGVRLLVASRRPLGIGLEKQVLVRGLSVPEEPADAAAILASEAGQLFVSTVRDEHPAFVLTDTFAPQIGRALREVAGAPLAVELAAARLMQIENTWELEPDIPTRADIAEELTEPLGHAVDQAVRWAVASLPPAARHLAPQAAAFPGGFNPSLAQKVFTNDKGEPQEDLEALLDLLRARALLRTWEPPGLAGDLRFGVVSSLRPRLLALLSPMEQEALQARLASALLEEALDHARWIDGPGGARMFARLAAETENLVDVLASALRHEPRRPAHVAAALRASLALDPVLSTRGYTDRQLRLMDDAIEAGRQQTAVEPKLLAMALEARADAFKSRGMLERARGDYREALAKAGEAGDKWFIGIVHRNLADVEHMLGANETALLHCREAHALLTAIGDRHFEGRVLLTWGRALIAKGDLDEAAGRLADAIDIFRHVGDRRFEGRALSLIAELRDGQGQHEGALELYASALAVHREVEDRRQLAATLVAQGRLLRRLRRAEESADRLRQARRLSRAMGNRSAEGHASYETAMLAGARGDLGKMREWLERARDILAEAGDTSLLPRIHEELKKMGPPL